ncbi:MAG: hypothetical protein QM820_55575 [Minicystis sp.]
MVPLDEYAHALAKTLKLWRDRRMPAVDVLTTLRDLGLTEVEAEAVIARGLEMGILTAEVGFIGSV